MIDFFGAMSIIGGIFSILSLIIMPMHYADKLNSFMDWVKNCFVHWSFILSLIIMIFSIIGFNYFEDKDFNNVQYHRNICEIGTVNYFEINAVEIERETYHLDETYFISGQNNVIKIGDVVEFCYKSPYRGKYLTSLNVVEIKD